MIYHAEKLSQKYEDGVIVSTYKIDGTKLKGTLVVNSSKNYSYPDRMTIVITGNNVQILDYEFKPTIRKNNGKASK